MPTFASLSGINGWLAQLAYGLAYGCITAWFDIQDLRAKATREVSTPDDDRRIANARAAASGLPRSGPNIPGHP